MKKAKIKKIISAIITAFTVIIVVFSLILIIVSASAKRKGEVPQLFGVMFFMVVTDSMEPHISAGDLIYATKVLPTEIEEGDDIIFYSQEPRYQGMLIVHRVDEIKEEDGVRYFYTKGINTPGRDEYPTREVLGIYKGKFSLLGVIIGAFQNRLSIFIIFAVVVFLFIATSQIKKITYEVNKAKVAKQYSYLEKAGSLTEPQEQESKDLEIDNNTPDNQEDNQEDYKIEENHIENQEGNQAENQQE